MTVSPYKRKGKPKFLMLQAYIVKSDAWQSLTPNERAAYLELKWRYDGFNNGWIGLGERELAKSLHTSRETARRALAGLVDKGFVMRARLSGFSMKTRVATEWRLTEYPCDATRSGPTKDFMRWRPSDFSQGHQRSKQGHHRSTQTDKSGQFSPDRTCNAPVEAISGGSQGHQRSTYISTIGGGD